MWALHDITWFHIGALTASSLKHIIGAQWTIYAGTGALTAHQVYNKRLCKTLDTLIHFFLPCTSKYDAASDDAITAPLTQDALTAPC